MSQPLQKPQKKQSLMDILIYVYIYISLFDTLVHIPFLLVFDEYTCSFVAIALAATAVLLQAVPMLQVPDLFFGLAACLAAQDWGRV